MPCVFVLVSYTFCMWPGVNVRAHMIPRAKAVPHRTCKVAEVVPTLWSESGAGKRCKAMQTKATDPNYQRLKAKINDTGMPATHDEISNKCKAIARKEIKN